MIGVKNKNGLFSGNSYLITPILLLGLISVFAFSFFANYRHQRYLYQRGTLNEDIVLFSHLLVRSVSIPINSLIHLSNFHQPTIKDYAFFNGVERLAHLNMVSDLVWMDKNGRVIYEKSRKKYLKDRLSRVVCPIHSICWKSLFKEAESQKRKIGFYEKVDIEDKSKFFLIYSYPLLTDKNQFEGVIFLRFLITDFIGKNILPEFFSQRYKILYLPFYLQSHDSGSLDVLNEVISTTTTVFFGDVGLRFKFTVSDNHIRWISIFLSVTGVVFSLILFWSLMTLRYDIKRRERAEYLLLEQQGFMKSIENCLSTAIFAVDLAGKIIHVNNAFCQFVDYPEQFLLGLYLPFDFLLPSDEQNSLDEFYNAVSSQRKLAQPLEFFIKRRSGEKISVLVYVAPLLTLDSKCIGNIITAIDIHEQKRLQKLMRWQQKRLELTSHLVTVGETASFLAHELNQPLGAIVAYATAVNNILKEGTFTNKQLLDITQKIISQSERASDIVRRVYSFVRRHDLVRTTVDLRDVVRRSVDAMDNNIRENSVIIKFDLPDFPCFVNADATLLVQVFINLVKNAIESMLNINYNRKIEISIEDCISEYAVMVRDNGVGVPTDICHRIFDAFVTTSNEGMGLGLSICRSIIESHRGVLDFETDCGKGTVFIVRLMKDSDDL
ncbi:MULTISPECIES: two-component system sensor histidine kinase NtrB [Candidatus Ichthyocystis]|uniref:histidine kinase n=1 Tax=Candidatus Ichthyocystis hellenicum TaxID=1561003 RepID=A0A0S4M330_9BURK|nr:MULTISPECIES: ATP-binding protein [Ichthyocystis]CUT18181.1 putative histidine kinase [Candidatus Ichthyocystis hellenicum]